MIRAILSFPQRYRRALIVMVHLGLVAASSYLAFWLRFDGVIPSPEMRLFWKTLPWLLVIRGLSFVPFRLHEGVWRYAGLWDLQNIVAAVGTSTVFFATFVRWGYGTDDYPRSIFIIDSILLVCLVGGLRLIPRIYRELSRRPREKRLLILGAGDSGEGILREIARSADYEYEPIGFVDDDAHKVGQRIHGVPILGGSLDLPKIMAVEKPHEVLVAIPSVNPAKIRELVRLLEPFKVPITTLANGEGRPNGKVGVSRIRGLSIEDLLTRAPVGLEIERVRGMLAGRRVLVTGAGGSIGSELCRQVAASGPASLVLYERYENGLYAIASDLGDRQYAFVHPVLGDVTDLNRLDAVMAEYRPQIIFHAAAHKHVPLIELNPCEAVKNNILGTRMLLEAADQHGVERFILISTDKAVNPSSVMGATKRVAELLAQTRVNHGATRVVTVRFGNVLGSNGSVVPRFLEQIKAGGPVTVTHPDIQRYFMLIPEAVQLVLHAAALARGGETFVLDMGEQIKVVDLARHLIRLAGLVPDEEIPITFVGLRAGEKLFEELVCDGEALESSPVNEILQVRREVLPDPALLEYELLALERAVAQDDCDAAIQRLCVLVPTFRPGIEIPVDPAGAGSAV